MRKELDGVRDKWSKRAQFVENVAIVVMLAVAVFGFFYFSGSC